MKYLYIGYKGIEERMEHKKIKDRIDALTGVRFWMIMIIVLSHLTCLRGEYPYSAFYNQYLHNATLGVDFFFMLSGFGMMYSYGENNVPVSIRGGGITSQLIVSRKYTLFI